MSEHQACTHLIETLPDNWKAQAEKIYTEIVVYDIYTMIRQLSIIAISWWYYYRDRLYMIYNWIKNQNWKSCKRVNQRRTPRRKFLGGDYDEADIETGPSGEPSIPAPDESP